MDNSRATPIPTLTPAEIRKIKSYYAQRWLDPVKRIEDIFNIRRADGSLVKFRIPEPQQKMLRDGILGKSRELVGSQVSYMGITNKGRQLGFSAVLAAEAILIAEDFPHTNIYYVATAIDQATDWMSKLDQLVRDANHYPPELGGGPILNVINIDKVFDKTINNTVIYGLPANPPSIRGKTGIHVIFDEAAWAIRFRNQAKETWKALRYIIRQGGSARIQSTPRTSDEEELFWGMYKKGESGNLALHQYYCPVIENWEELELDEPLWIDLDNARRRLKGMDEIDEDVQQGLIEKYKNRPMFEIMPGRHIRQKAVIPYWWVGLEDLEMDRVSDMEQFKQENLGIPLDETYKLIKSEWIYSNLNEGDEYDDRSGSQNPFYICVDLAQKNDITAITVIERMDDIYVERRIEETQDKYPKQVELIFGLFTRFKPLAISIDNTGHGIVIGDMLEKMLQDNGYSPRILRRVTFTMQTKEQMAIGFRNLVMPDAITKKSRYRWLYREKKHENAIRHCIRVEKEILPVSGIRYSGKMHGRDDHFWSKSQIALIEIPTGVPRAALGRMKKVSAVDSERDHRTYGEKFIEEQDKNRWKVDSEDIEAVEQINADRITRIRKARNLKFAIECLERGIVICRNKHKPVKPLHCAFPGNCSDSLCPGYRYVVDICNRYEVTKHDIWQKQTTFPR